MLVEDVRKRVERIRAMAGDYEVAHGEEDELYRDVLEMAAKQKHSNVGACAREALKAQAIDFPRYCA